MKIVKRIFIGIVVVVALLLIVALFIPRTYTVSVSTQINKPKPQVFDFVKSIKNQEKYSVWILSDPNIDLKYEGIDGTVGFKSSWDSKDDNIGENMGEGSQQIVSMTEDRIDIDLHFIRPFEGNQKAALIVTETSPEITTVTSEFYGNDPYPMNLLSVIGKSMLKDAQEKNLKNLKAILEK